MADCEQNPSREKSSTPEQSSSSMLNLERRITDSDRERKSFRPSYDGRMRNFSKEMLTSADFRECCRSVFIHCRGPVTCTVYSSY